MVRKLSFVAAAALAALAAAAVAGAGHITSGVKSYTGCLVPNDGVIVKVKEGNAPKSACTGGQTEVHLSGGDITRITVTGALSGGGDNGEVTIGLKPEFTLPSGCASGQVAKWNGTAWACAADNDTTYSAGTGLALSGTEFSIASDYRVKNTPDCGSGQFATGFSDAGTIQCTAPSASLQALTNAQANYESGAGLADDGTFHEFASVGVSAGTYLVSAKGIIKSEGNVDDFSATECRIQNGATMVDSVRYGSVTIDDNPSTTFALTGVAVVSGGTIALACAADEGADGVGLSHGRIAALRVG